jgi:hypothetical protein
MRASIPASILFAAIASCSSISYGEDQEAALSSIMSKLNALTSNTAYTPFQTVAESVAVEFYKTQTVVASINPDPTDAAEASANLELSFAYMSEVENFAETQTIISDALKATVTAVLIDYMSVMSDIQISTSAMPSETGKVSVTDIQLSSSTKASKSTTMESVTSKASSTLDTVTSKATSSATSAAASSLSEEPSVTESGAASASSDPASGALGRTVSRMFAGAVAGVVAAVVLL